VTTLNQCSLLTKYFCIFSKNIVQLNLILTFLIQVCHWTRHQHH